MMGKLAFAQSFFLELLFFSMRIVVCFFSSG